MHMKHHPFVRTAQDLRRSIARMENFLLWPTPIPDQEVKAAKAILNMLKEAHRAVPDEYRDADIKGRE